MYRLSFLQEEVTEVFLFSLFQAFDCSIGKDEHLAVAFFQRGITFYRKKRQEKPLSSIKCPLSFLIRSEDSEAFCNRHSLVPNHCYGEGGVLDAKVINWIIPVQRYEESLADFQHSFKTLRGNQLIDYKALGLRYKLYACDVSI